MEQAHGLQPTMLRLRTQEKGLLWHKKYGVGILHQTRKGITTVKTYHVKYIMRPNELFEKGCDVQAHNKVEALEKAELEVIPNIENAYPYRVLIYGCTCGNGNFKHIMR